MQANVGDRIVIRGHRVGEPERDCKVLAVQGEDGGPPHTVDDLLIDLAADLVDLARPVTAEVLFGHHDAPVPAVN